MSEFQAQHPIPQQISSYQFRLVGDMTLKQFFQVAGGALVALILYSSNIVGFVKWPMIVTSVLFGVALAFFPFEDRPLDKWLILFFKSIYSPTVFTWIKGSAASSYFQSPTESTDASLASTSPQDANQIQQLENETQNQQKVATAPVGIQDEASGALKGLEQNETQFLNQVSMQLTKEPQKALGSLMTNTNTAYSETQADKNMNQEPDTTVTPIANPPEKTDSVPFTNDNFNNPVSSAQTAIPSQQNPQIVEKTISMTPPPNYQSANNLPQESSFNQSQATVPASFSDDTPPPIPPMQPNIVVGQVTDDKGQVVESAILEIRDTDGRPARAIKSNKLGHFGIVTQLSPGKYEITTEKDGLEFDPVHFEANGEILQPIAIRATTNISYNEV